MCTIICEDRPVTEQTMVAHRSHRRFHRVSHHPPARRWHRASMKCRVDSMGWETTTSTTVTTITAVQAHPLMCRTATVLTIWRHLLHVKRNRWEWFFARISISYVEFMFRRNHRCVTRFLPPNKFVHLPRYDILMNYCIILLFIKEMYRNVIILVSSFF